MKQRLSLILTFEDMKKNELRIGNLLLWNRDKEQLPPEVVCVFNIYESYCRVSVDSDLEDIKLYYEYAKGIPLTEEWLIKLGFKKDHHGFRLEDLYSLSISVTKEGEFLPCFADRVLHKELKVKEVHQLQNLYFSLTGKELTFDV